MCLGNGLGIGNGGHPGAFHQALQVREPRHRQSDTVLAMDVTHTLNPYEKCRSTIGKP